MIWNDRIFLYFLGGIMAIFIRKRNVSTSYETLVKKILKEGEYVKTEMGDLTKELRNVLVEITDPSDKTISKRYVFGSSVIDRYIDQLLNGSSGGFVYDYHERLFRWNGEINQIQYIIDKLKYRKESRRALAITWNPYVDIRPYDDDFAVPCLQYIQFLVRKGKLEMSVLFRSNDVLLAFHSNALGLIRLGEMIADELGVEMDRYFHYIVSAHIYVKRDEDYLKKYFSDVIY